MLPLDDVSFEKQNMIAKSILKIITNERKKVLFLLFQLDQIQIFNIMTLFLEVSK